MRRARTKKNTTPIVVVEQAESSRYSGPWWVIEADALHSGYKGRVDLGKYSETEAKKGVVTRRVGALTAEGYKNVTVREITGNA